MIIVSWGRLSSLVDSAGKLTTLRYNSLGNLTAITYPDNSFKTLLYEVLNFPNHLTGIVNENGVRIALLRKNK